MNIVDWIMELATIEKRFAEIKKKITGRDMKENTIKNNAKMILKLYTGVGTTSSIPTSNIEEWIDSQSFSLTTQRNYYSLMLAMIRWDIEFGEVGKDLSSIQEFYIEKITDLEKVIQQNKMARVVSDKKVEQQISLFDMKQVIITLYAHGHEADELMLKILMKFPYRAEVGTLIYMKLMDYKKLVKSVGGINNLTKNYLVVGSSKMFVSRSDYKTFDKYGTILNDITTGESSLAGGPDKRLEKDIRKYLKDHKIVEGEPMFGYTDRQEVSKRLSYITKKYTDISMGPAAIVKVMLSSHKFKDMAEAADFLRESSRIRGTSLATLQDVYLHKSPLEE